ncbi:SDR family NAD(P)-dependent oxidoreductase [Azospirillum sp. TSA2s]|uniref:SDR family NAD(P)-dependent oxidoreductase n=1 Tax=Azospirillum sp. TSA2s TaxID=709810 RepID=UPI0010A9D3E0|nr:SDR family NAD(P)-dependent oxidoreductase [Azospirillum sp. TSA2s]QCG93290.1 SDR family NAD(P)-dependent oxidoreductase [Azospirillum sp. TSA2s]
MNPSTHPVIVTGAASGLGAATARAFAAAGSKVALLDLSAERLASIAEETGGLAIPCDVTDAASAERAVAMAAGAHGPARILVNCAGIAPAGRIVGRDGPQPLDEFARVVSVNLIGTFNLMRLAAAAMTTLEPLEDGERGVIVNTASIAAYEGQIGQAAYAASKGGVASLTLPAARELARYGVRVAAIAPGLFGTPMVTAMPQEVQDAIVANIPFPHRFGKPEEYARMVLSIVENPMVNGSVIRLDAALRMQPK